MTRIPNLTRRQRIITIVWIVFVWTVYAASPAERANAESGPSASRGACFVSAAPTP
jgi:hypothetical protein